jgi:hypothetical protein
VSYVAFGRHLIEKVAGPSDALANGHLGDVVQPNNQKCMCKGISERRIICYDAFETADCRFTVKKLRSLIRLAA